VTVGDPGNVADPDTGYGAVSYTYQVGEYDVTVGQYCQFLNAVAKTDTYGLYNSAMAPGIGPAYGFRTLGVARSGSSGNYSYSVAGSYSEAANCPIFDVSWGDAARFVNWLANGQPNGPEGPGTTETGTYALNGGTSNAALMAVTRSSSATWVLPTVNEWYRASYYVGGGANAGYWTYATQSNMPPSNVLSPTETNNANFTASGGGLSSDPINFLTPVGSFADSPSAYGAYDQSGDVWQWNETAYSNSGCGLHGGSYADVVGAMIAGTYDVGSPALSDPNVGFALGLLGYAWRWGRGVRASIRTS
jgi:formylglycine-generating enzyme required for sulfatase activity